MELEGKELEVMLTYEKKDEQFSYYIGLLNGHKITVVSYINHPVKGFMLQIDISLLEALKIPSKNILREYLTFKIIRLPEKGSICIRMVLDKNIRMEKDRILWQMKKEQKEMITIK